MRRNTPERILARVKQGPACWAWTGAHFRSGYARVKVDGKDTVAHRVIYELLVGPIPDGLEIDHLCENRGCVNPAHMEPVTGRTNVLRAASPIRANSEKTHCHKGHPLSGDNLFVRRDGRRRCRTCERASQKRLRARPEQKAKHAAYERSRRAARKEQHEAATTY